MQHRCFGVSDVLSDVLSDTFRSNRSIPDEKSPCGVRNLSETGPSVVSAISVSHGLTAVAGARFRPLHRRSQHDSQNGFRSTSDRSGARTLSDKCRKRQATLLMALPVSSRHIGAR